VEASKSPSPRTGNSQGVIGDKARKKNSRDIKKNPACQSKNPVYGHTNKHRKKKKRKEGANGPKQTTTGCGGGGLEIGRALFKRKRQRKKLKKEPKEAGKRAGKG